MGGTVIIMATDLEQLTGESYLVLAYILRNSCQARMIKVLNEGRWPRALIQFYAGLRYLLVF